MQVTNIFLPFMLSTTRKKWCLPKGKLLTLFVGAFWVTSGIKRIFCLTYFCQNCRSFWNTAILWYWPSLFCLSFFYFKVAYAWKTCLKLLWRQDDVRIQNQVMSSRSKNIQDKEHLVGLKSRYCTMGELILEMGKFWLDKVTT